MYFINMFSLTYSKRTWQIKFVYFSKKIVLRKKVPKIEFSTVLLSKI